MIYIIDHQDSFTWNVVHQFSQFDKVYCTNYFEINENILKKCSTIVLSPGPGAPKDYPKTSKIYNELSENFEVTLKGSLKFYTDDLTENEKLLIDNSKHNHLCVYGFHIEEANNSLGADFLFDQRDYI